MRRTTLTTTVQTDIDRSTRLFSSRIAFRFCTAAAILLSILGMTAATAVAQDWPDSSPSSSPAQASDAQVEPTPVTGHVIDSTGAPLAGASIRLETLRPSRAGGDGGNRNGRRGRGFSRSVHAETNAEGAFRIQPNADGSFLLEVTHNGFRTYRHVVADSRTASSRMIVMTRGSRPTRVQWISSLGEAMARSNETGRPAMVFMTMDGERANDYMAAVTYREAGVVELASHLHPLVSSSFTHSDNDETECPKYGTVTCAQHKEVERRVRAIFFPSDETIDTPQHLFLGPGATLIDRRRFQVSSAELRNLMIGALRMTHPTYAVEAASEYYADLRNDLERGNTVARVAAMDALLMLADSGDEVARTALLAVDPSRFSRDQEDALLDRVVTTTDAGMIESIAQLVARGSENFRAGAIRRLQAGDAAAAAANAQAREAGNTRIPATRSFGRLILIETLARATDAALRAEIESTLGVTRSNGRLVFPDDMNERTQFSVALALSNHADPTALPLLEETLAAPANATQRTDAGMAVMRYPTTVALSILESELARGGSSRAVLARLVGELGDLRGADTLMAALDDDSTALRCTAARALGHLGYRDAIPVLIRMIDDETIDSSVRVAAAAALVDLGSTAGIRPLIDHVENPVLGGTAREALRDAHATTAPRSSSEWRRWWNEQRDDG